MFEVWAHTQSVIELERQADKMICLMDQNVQRYAGSTPKAVLKLTLRNAITDCNTAISALQPGEAQGWFELKKQLFMRLNERHFPTEELCKNSLTS